MSLWFSDIDEYEDYEDSCSLLGTSDDKEYAETRSEQYDKSCSLLSVRED